MARCRTARQPRCGGLGRRWALRAPSPSADRARCRSPSERQRALTGTWPRPYLPAAAPRRPQNASRGRARVSPGAPGGSAYAVLPGLAVLGLSSFWQEKGIIRGAALAASRLQHRGPLPGRVRAPFREGDEPFAGPAVAGTLVVPVAQAGGWRSGRTPRAAPFSAAGEVDFACDWDY